MRRLVFRLVSMTSAAFALCLGLTLGAGPAGAAEFGPDDFGYTGADDAEESVTYEWVDFATATEAGELTPLPDDAQLDPLPIGFDFVFYGQTYAEVHPTTNGAFAFRRLIDYQFFAGEQCPLPTDGDVNGIVAFFLRDFNPDDPACDDSCHVRWARGGEEGSRWFGVEYENVPVYREAATDPAAAVTVQALLYEGTNEVRIQIADAGPALGGDATVGIEAPDAIAGLNVPGCLLEGSLRNEMAVVFRPPTGGTPVVPPHRTAWEQPGEAVDYTFTVFNLEAAEASFDLAVTGNTWDTALSDTTIAVLPGDFAAFTATVTIPAEAAGGSSDGATITLTPTGGGDALRSTVLTLVQDFPDDWQLLPEMPLVVDSPAVAVDGTDVFLIGGIVWDELALQKLVTDYVQKLDTETMAWTESDTGGLAVPPDVRVDARACAMDGKVYLTGGQTLVQEEPVGKNLWVYDVATNEWTEGPDMPEGRMNHAAVCVPALNKVFVLGGLGPPEAELFVEKDTIWAFDVAAQTWDDTLAPMPTTRSYLTAEYVEGSHILAAGGFVDDFLDRRSDWYDIAQDTWEQVADINVERLLHASALMDGDRMCIIGGSSFNALLEDTYECFSGGFWIPQIALINLPRTFVMGGTVGTQMYVFGGVEADSPFQPTEYTQYGLVERYPTSNLPDPPPAEVCNDDVDNDLDGATDCDDADCDANPLCAGPPDEVCNDGVDNDGDGDEDCDDADCDGDPACAPDAEICTDTLDNDGDGDTDCDDSDCAAHAACQPAVEICNDGVDNDGDDDEDCDDADCDGHAACAPDAEICTDTIDNDGDGDADCDDSDCAAAAHCQGAPTAEVCDDTVDNDGDGQADCDDTDCAAAAHCQGGPTAEVCNDSIDNDGDGQTDCDDTDCAADAACTGGGGTGGGGCTTTGTPSPTTPVLLLLALGGLVAVRRGRAG